MARPRTHIGSRSRRRPRLTFEDDRVLLGSRAEHEGRVPQPGIPAGPRNTPSSAGSESAGYHYDAVPKGGSGPGETPIAAPLPSQAAQGPAGRYEGAGRAYTRALAALPDPIAALSPPLADARPYPGAPVPTAGRPTSALLAGLSPLLASVLAPATEALTPALEHLAVPEKIEETEAAIERYRKKGIGPFTPEEDAKFKRLDHRGIVDEVLSSNPNRPAHPPRDPADPLGKKTVGDVSAAELAKATEDGTLKINAGGRITTPEVRDVLANLKAAEKAAGPDIAQLHAQFPELSPPKIRALFDAQRRTGTPAPLLAGIVGIESDYGRSTLPGVHSGANFAGAAGAFQIGNGSGEAGDAWSQVSDELWGDKADQHSIYNFHDAAVGAGQYLQTFPSRPATKDPSTWYDAALSYNHADWYAQDVVTGAEAHLGLKPAASSPEALQALRAAKQQARAEGINPTPFNGDVAGGGTGTVTIRADAKGMVDWAESAIGLQEGTPRQLNINAKAGISPSEPWCAAFVAAGLRRRGVEPPAGPAGSWNYADPNWKGATQIGTDLSKAKPGDLVVFGSGDHIAIYAGNGEVIAGNWGNEVARYPASDDGRGVSAIARPHYKGGKIEVAEGQIPGSSATTTFAGASGPAVGGAEPATSSAGGANGGTGGARPNLALTPLASPLAAGPILPTEVADAGAEHTESAAENLIAMLGEGGLGVRRPTL